jgi:mono/diheme cytochrome c family protein
VSNPFRPSPRDRARSVVCGAVLPLFDAVLVNACDGGGSAGKASASSAAVDSTVPLAVRGYTRVCANCHMEHGKGMPPAYRSLVGSPWVIGNPDRTIAIVVYGVQGPVIDSNYTYHTAMLPYGSGMPMSDAEVAAVVTHIRTSWGNSASAVTAEDVARVKAQFGTRNKGFTQRELDAMGSG